MITVALAGVAGGILAGLFGVGGGILFVPALVLVGGLSHIEAEATSLLAIVPIALLGAWRQHRYGNVRVGDGLKIGALSAAGALGGVALANTVPERALKTGFAILLLVTAAQLVRRAFHDTGGPR
jgi:uncharacterized membrane protein YfcA